MTPTEGALAGVRAETLVKDWLDDGEIVLLIARPSIKLLPAYAAVPLCLLLAAGMGIWTAGKGTEWLSAEMLDGMLLALGCVAGLVLAVQVYRWRARQYVLTNRRIVRRTGLLRATVRQAVLPRLTKIEVIPFPPEQITGLATICFQVDGAFRSDLSWGNLAQADRIAQNIRQALRRGGGTPSA